MKKILATCLLACLTYSPSIIRAFEIPGLPEGGIIDDITHWGTEVKNRFTKEGIANGSLLFSTNPYLEGEEMAGYMAFQLAHPIFKNMMGSRYLSRIEGNLNFIASDKIRADEGKIGISGRYIVNPYFIAGGYLFGSVDMNKAHYPIMANTGIELMWPQYGTIVWDGIFTPKNLFNSKRGCYQTSLKFTITKPRVFDIFGAFVLRKHIQCKEELSAMFGFKAQAPIKKWKIRERATWGFGISYSPQAETWFSPRNIHGSFYIQINFLKNRPQASLKDYLRMPIDRYVAQPFTPYHPHYNENS